MSLILLTYTEDRYDNGQLRLLNPIMQQATSPNLLSILKIQPPCVSPLIKE